MFSPARSLTVLSVSASKPSSATISLAAMSRFCAVSGSDDERVLEGEVEVVGEAGARPSPSVLQPPGAAAIGRSPPLGPASPGPA